MYLLACHTWARKIADEVIASLTKWSDNSSPVAVQKLRRPFDKSYAVVFLCVFIGASLYQLLQLTVNFNRTNGCISCASVTKPEGTCTSIATDTISHSYPLLQASITYPNNVTFLRSELQMLWDQVWNTSFDQICKLEPDVAYMCADNETYHNVSYFRTSELRASL